MTPGVYSSPWRGYKMRWEIWRHDGPNPGSVDVEKDRTNNANWEYSDDNNPYYVDLVGPYEDEGICKQRLRVLALENSYVRIQLRAVLLSDKCENWNQEDCFDADNDDQREFFQDHVFLFQDDETAFKIINP